MVTSLGLPVRALRPFGKTHGLQGRRRGHQQEGPEGHRGRHAARVMYWRDGGGVRRGLCADVCKLQLAKDRAGVAASAMKDVVSLDERRDGPSARQGLPLATWRRRSTRRSATTWPSGRSVDGGRRAHPVRRLSPTLFVRTLRRLMAQPDIDGCRVGGARASARFARDLSPPRRNVAFLARLSPSYPRSSLSRRRRRRP